MKRYVSGNAVGIKLLDIGMFLAASVMFFASTALAQVKGPVKPGGPVNNQTCLSCHNDPSEKTFVNPAQFAASVHGTGMCTECHTDITEVPHGTVARVNCGRCHSDEMKVFDQSIHGKALAMGKREAPGCSDCHGDHAIKPVKESGSTVSSAHLAQTCGQCHAAERITTRYRLPNFVVSTYMESYHGLSVQRGSLKAANCASCHNNHDIRPASDPRSSINPANLAKTCGTCHPGMGKQVIQGKIHSGSKPELSAPLTNIVRSAYLVLIFMVIGMMLFHNILDLVRKMSAHYRYMASLGKPLRWGLSERIQHTVLAVSFLILAYTGFALRHPHAWWASPFLGADDWRGMGHRFAALVFVLLSGFHAWFLIFTAKGRWHFNQLRPRLADLAQLGQTMAYYLGRRQEKPRPAFYSYIEKMEYWALVWGSMVMILTGGVILQKEWFLSCFSKEVLDAVATVHYYEAILACLAILVWHVYFVIFDPDVYPMKWTWMDGKSSPSDDERTT